MKNFTTDKWIDIPNTRSMVTGFERAKTTERSEKEKLHYWSNFYQKKNRIGASSCIW